jgi:GDP-4-dehydro-6-deoxy-D-mannose reductase
MTSTVTTQSTILITGGSGFAGSHLIENLVQHGYQNIHTTVFGKKPDYLARHLPSENIHRVNLTEPQEVAELLQLLQPTQIYHLAALAFVGESFKRGREVLENNILLQHTLLEAVRQFSPQSRLLTVGSAEEYGLSEPDEIPINENHPLRPINPYAVSKITQDLLAYAYGVSFGLDVVRVRPFNHIGERQSVDFALPAFAKQIVDIEKGDLQVLKVGNLEGVRDFTDVKDVVEAYRVVMEKGEANEVYNIGSGQGVKMKEIVDLLINLATVPISLEVDQSRMRPLDIPTVIADNRKVRSLGWEPKIPLNESLDRIIQDWRKNS